MRKIFYGVLAIIAMVVLSGCANKVHDYSVSTENLMELKKISKSGKTVKLGAFTDSGKGERSVMCRLATPIGTPTGETFASYIQNAMKKEMIVADVYSNSAKNTLTANLNDIYGSSTLGNAYWELDMTVKSSNGKNLRVKSRYEYESSFTAYSACSEMQRSYPLAVQKVIKDVIKNPKFISLTK